MPDTRSRAQLSLFSAPSRSVARLLAEVRAREQKGHAHFYEAFDPSESRVLHEHFCGEVVRQGFPSPASTGLHVTNLAGTPLALGYTRVVIGDYGAFVEFSPEQMHMQNLRPRWKGAPARPTKYLWLVTADACQTKVYLQQATVAYADYRVGMYYVAPCDVRITR